MSGDDPRARGHGPFPGSQVHVETRGRKYLDDANLFLSYRKRYRGKGPGTVSSVVHRD
jgi:hypothetical protein